MHRCEDGRVVVVEYEVHGRVVASDAAYENRFVGRDLAWRAIERGYRVMVTARYFESVNELVVVHPGR